MRCAFRPWALAALSLPFLTSVPAAAQIQLTPGDVAIIGWIDNGSPSDALAIVALADLPAGATVYFTDNGWDSTTSTFRNTNGATDGDGNEQLLRFSTSALVPAGTIVTTNDVSPNFQWTTTGAIPGATTGSFAIPVLAQTGDQVYAFQHDTGSNPLNTPIQQHLYALDDTGTFEDATSTATGNVPAGLTVAAHTAVSFAQAGSGQNFMAFQTSSLASGSKAQWLAAIANASNWAFGASGTLPSGTIVVGGGSFPTWCAGDGSLAVACPCANTGTTGHGCDNSSATGGALLVASGSAQPDTLQMHASGMVPTGFALLLQGDAALASAAAFGDGLRCVGGALRKLAVAPSGGGSATFPQPGAPSISSAAAAVGDAIAPGSVRHYQVYYRDAQLAFCDLPQGGSWNASNALTVTW